MAESFLARARQIAQVKASAVTSLTLNLFACRLRIMLRQAMDGLFCACVEAVTRGCHVYLVPEVASRQEYEAMISALHGFRAQSRYKIRFRLMVWG